MRRRPGAQFNPQSAMTARPVTLLVVPGGPGQAPVSTCSGSSAANRTRKGSVTDDGGVGTRKRPQEQRQVRTTHFLPGPCARTPLPNRTY